MEKGVVDDPDHCLAAAGALVALVDEHLAVIERGGQLLTGGVPRHCRVCGRGQYQKVELDENVTGEPVVNLSMAGIPIEVCMFTFDRCRRTHFFPDNHNVRPLKPPVTGE